MRLLLQRVARASVAVDGEVVGAIGRGLLVFVGVAGEDTEAVADALADKALGLRIFDDDDGRINLSLADVGGGALVVSQFTLYADARKGRRPSFVAAARPERAAPLVERVAQRLRDGGVAVATGRFGAMMSVELLNDGPFTILLDSEDLGRPRRS